MILVVSAPNDAHAREVMSRLAAKRKKAQLLDLSSFPARCALTIGLGRNEQDRGCRFEGEGGPLELGECSVIWWRRPQPFGLHAEVGGPEARNFAFSETHSAISGMWLVLDAYWINHPTRDEEAARKVYQLQVARQVGFRTPDTCITNDAQCARRFIEAQGGPEQTIYKSFSGTEAAWRETRLLKPEEMALLDNVKFAPVIFQEYIPADVDLRITMIGEQIFPAAIHSQETEYKVDFRMTMEKARFEAVELPPKVVRMLRDLMKRLGLVYGAIDMRRTPKGEYVFLEINPAGQWLFVEERTGQRISDALADLLAAHERG